MTRDDIIRIGQKVGLLARTESLLAKETLLLEMLERFAVLVAAAEREECAKVCEAFDNYVAAAVRARGEK